MKHKYYVDIDLSVYYNDKLEKNEFSHDGTYTCEFCNKKLMCYKYFINHIKKFHFKDIFNKSFCINDILNLMDVSNENDIIDMVKSDIVKVL